MRHTHKKNQPFSGGTKSLGVWKSYGRPMSRIPLLLEQPSGRLEREMAFYRMLTHLVSVHAAHPPQQHPTGRVLGRPLLIARSCTIPGAMLRIPCRAIGSLLSVNSVYYTYEHTAISSENEEWPHMSACHAGRLGDHWTPVGSGRFRDHAQDPRGVLSISFPPPLLLGKRAVWHTLMGDHAGAEVALLAQLRLPLETRSKASFPTRESSSLLLSHSHVLLFEEVE
jgi:hypothetical protein